MFETVVAIVLIAFGIWTWIDVKRENRKLSEIDVRLDKLRDGMVELENFAVELEDKISAAKKMVLKNGGADSSE